LCVSCSEIMITVLSAVFVWKKGQQGANSLADTNCHILKVQVPPGLALPAGPLRAARGDNFYVQ
jgi:hypothetical protein